MDALGKRLIEDRETAAKWRRRADQLEADAKKLRRDADELERVAEMSRLQS